ncbi:hypothetical protein FQA54_20085, partial [Salmonella enterica]|nr:hypothetical protein [Salmonella enterica]
MGCLLVRDIRTIFCVIRLMPMYRSAIGLKSCNPLDAEKFILFSLSSSLRLPFLYMWLAVKKSKKVINTSPHESGGGKLPLSASAPNTGTVMQKDIKPSPTAKKTYMN